MLNLAQGISPTTKVKRYTCNNDFLARTRAEHGIPTWLVRYFRDRDNLRLHDTSGAWHGAELPNVLWHSRGCLAAPILPDSARYSQGHAEGAGGVRKRPRKRAHGRGGVA